MKRHLPVACTLLLAFLVSGCGLSYFQDRGENPVVFDPIGSSGFLGAPRSFAAISAQAGRSTILVNIAKDSKFFGTFCAAPPPDAAENLTTYFALRAEAAASDQTKTLEGKGTLAFEDSFARSLAPLVRRSQGLELFKYGMFYYCQDFLNGRITENELVDLRADLLEASREAINLEVKNDKWYGFPPAYGAPAASTALFNCSEDPNEKGRFICNGKANTESAAGSETKDNTTTAETPSPPPSE